MEQIPCIYCGDFFDPSPRHKNQTACKKQVCQKAKRAAWQRYKLKHDPARSGVGPRYVIDIADKVP